MIELGERIRQIRRLKNMSQIELERKTGIKREYLSKIENQELKNPTYRTLERLAQGLGVPLPELIAEALEAKAPREPRLDVIAPKDWVSRIDKEIKAGTYLVVPVISRVLATRAPECIQQEQVEEFVFLLARFCEPTLDSARYRGVRLRDDDWSMVPCLAPGTVVVVDSYQRDPNALDKALVLLCDGEDGCVVREIRLGQKVAVAIPLAVRDYPPTLLTGRKNLVLGKVVWCVQKFG